MQLRPKLIQAIILLLLALLTFTAQAQQELAKPATNIPDSIFCNYVDRHVAAAVFNFVPLSRTAYKARQIKYGSIFPIPGFTVTRLTVDSVHRKFSVNAYTVYRNVYKASFFYQSILAQLYTCYGHKGERIRTTHTTAGFRWEQSLQETDVSDFTVITRCVLIENLKKKTWTVMLSIYRKRAAAAIKGVSGK